MADTATSNQQAWRDWSRVERCLEFAMNRWALTLAGLWAAWHWLDPISGWLALIASIAILWLQNTLVKRDNAKRLAEDAESEKATVAKSVHTHT